MATFVGQADSACLEFQEASDKHVMAGRDLGSFMYLKSELQAADHNSTGGSRRIMEINAMPIMARSSKEFSDDLSSAETYMKFCEERM